MKMKNNVIAISMIGILLFSCFAITPAFGSEPDTTATITIEDPNPANESIDVALDLSKVSVYIDVTEIRGSLPFMWAIGGDNITTNKSKEPELYGRKEANITGPLLPNTKINWYVNVTVPAVAGLYKNVTFSFTTFNEPPIANFTNTTHGLKVDFNGSSAHDEDGTITNYTWYLGDGNISYGKVTQHIYAEDGNYAVSLNVTDNGDKTDNITKIITVENALPVASFTYSINGKKVTFDASSSKDIDGTIVNYTWDFDDGIFGYQSVMTHTYSKEDKTYTVILKVTDNKGNYSTISKNVKINDTTKPTIQIVKPERAVYINNEKKRQRFFGMAFIIGNITIEVNASDVNGSGIDKVEFYINGILKGNDTVAPYNYTWMKDRLRFIHLFVIKVVAYDKAGNTAVKRMVVRKFL